MKKFLTFLMMSVFAFGIMMANWHPSDMDATRLDNPLESGQVQMKTLHTPEGNIVLTWLRGEVNDGIFSYKLHMQVFDANGNARFGDEGIIVCDKPTRSWTTDYGMTLADNGDIIMAYTDIRNDPEETMVESYLYRYTQQGEPVWDKDGILFPTSKIHEEAFVVEDAAPQVCVSGNNIYAAVSHTEYYMEEANEDNWQPSPWFPNQPMPDSVQVTDTKWFVFLLNDNGELVNEEPLTLNSTILVMNPASDDQAYLLYDNDVEGLDGQLVNADLENVWGDPVTVETRTISNGYYVPTPLTAVDEAGVLMISYRVLTDWYGYQVVNYLNEYGGTSPEAVSLTGHIDGDAGSTAMGVNENRAFVAWEWAYSNTENHVKVNCIDDMDEYWWDGDNKYGVSLDMNDTWGFTPVKVIPVSDGWVVLYGNNTSWNGATFMVVKIDEFGNEMWRKQICEDNFKSSGFAVTYDENNAYIFYTQDVAYDSNYEEIPGSGGMYVMCVDITGNPSTSINEVKAAEGVVKTEIYTIDGRRVNELENGVNIIRTTDADGNVTTIKVLN